MTERFFFSSKEIICGFFDSIKNHSVTIAFIAKNMFKIWEKVFPRVTFAHAYHDARRGVAVVAEVAKTIGLNLFELGGGKSVQKWKTIKKCQLYFLSGSVWDCFIFA